MVISSQKCGPREWSSLIASFVISSIVFLEGKTGNGMVLEGRSDTQERALHRLLQVFEMEQMGRREHHNSPPQYMLDLYNSVVDSSGVTRTLSSHPYQADVVRSYQDRDVSHSHHFLFNLTSGIPAKEQLLEAEFHLYKIKPHSRHRQQQHQQLTDVRSHLLELRLYQVMSPNSAHREEGNKLLDSRRVSLESSGWEVFYVKSAVMDWLKNHSCNHGLLLSVKTILGVPLDEGILRFAKRHQHHGNKQPILVLFTSIDRVRRRLYNSITDGRNYGYTELSHHNGSPTEAQSDLFKQDQTSVSTDVNSTLAFRKRRSVHEQESATEEEEEGEEEEEEENEGMMEETEQDDEMITEPLGCSRRELYVDFEKIGWASWIISPKGYHAYFCKGGCAFPLGQNQWPTNHATVQSIVHELNLTPDVGMPCCVPNKLYPINLLYFDEHENVVLKQYEDMVVVSCGCH